MINFFASDKQLLGPDSGIIQTVQDLSNNLLTSNHDASFNNVDISNHLTVLGDVSLNANVDINGDLTLNGNLTMNKYISRQTGGQTGPHQNGIFHILEFTTNSINEGNLRDSNAIPLKIISANQEGYYFITVSAWVHFSNRDGIQAWSKLLYKHTNPANNYTIDDDILQTHDSRANLDANDVNESSKDDFNFYAMSNTGIAEMTIGSYIQVEIYGNNIGGGNSLYFQELRFNAYKIY